MITATVATFIINTVIFIAVKIVPINLIAHTCTAIASTSAWTRTTFIVAITLFRTLCVNTIATITDTAIALLILLPLFLLLLPPLLILLLFLLLPLLLLLQCHYCYHYYYYYNNYYYSYYCYYCS